MHSISLFINLDDYHKDRSFTCEKSPWRFWLDIGTSERTLVSGTKMTRSGLLSASSSSQGELFRPSNLEDFESWTMLRKRISYIRYNH